jgi:hypothetical protein
VGTLEAGLGFAQITSDDGTVVANTVEEQAEYYASIFKLNKQGEMVFILILGGI